MVNNMVSTLLVAIFSLCSTAFGSAIVVDGDQCIILDGDGHEVVVTGDLHTVETASKIAL